MLLTSSQVSVAVSAGIVILCTFALFISGYVLQQRTLRQLRQSIRMPSPEPPKIFLPDRFNKMTTELSDGTIVTIDSDEDENGKAVIVADNAPSKSQASPLVGGQQDNNSNNVNNVNKSVADIVVQVKQSQPGAEDQAQPQQQAQQKPEQQKAPDVIVIPAAADQKPVKPVSKAERRRLIKEELMRMGANEKPVYYQRRLY